MKIKTIIKTISKKQIWLLFYISLFLCCWSIFAVDLNILPLIKTSIPENICEKINRVLSNLSYGYITGCIFFLLTVVLPHNAKTKTIYPVLNIKIRKIRGYISNTLLEFSRQTGFNHNDFSENNCVKILMSKSWTDIIPMFQEMQGVRISHLHHLYAMNNNIDKEVNEIIALYNSYLTESQIVLLEELRNAEFCKTVAMFVYVQRINLDDPAGKTDFIKSFCKMVQIFIEIEKTFKISYDNDLV